MNRYFAAFVTILMTLSSCVSRIAVRKDFDFNKINKVAVLTFEGDRVIGEAAADEFVRQLLMAGVDVTEVKLGSSDYSNIEKKAERLGVDAYIKGTVAKYEPQQNFFVYREDRNTSGTIILGNPVIELGTSKVYRRNNVSDSDDSFLLFTNASLTINSRMVNVADGGIIWANSYTYEGLDTASCIEYTIRYFLNTLKPYWGKLNIK